MKELKDEKIKEFRRFSPTYRSPTAFVLRGKKHSDKKSEELGSGS